MKDKKNQIEEIETIIKSNLAEGSFANAFARKVAIQIVEHYQLKLPEDSVVQPTVQSYSTHDNDLVVLSKPEKQKLLHEMYEQGRFDALADLDKEDKLVLSREELHEAEENAYQVGIALGKRLGGRATAEKFAKAVKDRIKFIKTYLHIDGVEYLGLEDFDVDNILIGDFGIEIKE